MKTIIREEVLQSDLTAIADDKGKKFTYRELRERAQGLENFMEERSLVFILCDHQLETIGFVYQVLTANRVPLLLAPDIGQDMLDNLISIYEPGYIYCRRKHLMCRQYAGSFELEEHVLLQTGGKSFDIHPDVALLLSTSGTTGSAKLVKLSYDNLYDNSEYACRHLGIESSQKGISPLPVNYTYGFAFCLWHWHCGATLLVTDKPVISREFKDFYVRERANNFAATPYSWQMLQRVRFWDEENIPYLHFAMSGGGQMPEKDQISLVALLKEKFWIGYGQTECTCIVTAMNFDERNIKTGSIGKPFANMEVLTDKDTGELLIKSKSICMGYANCKKQLAEGDVNHGIMRTGDVADMDEDGCIYLKGRLTRYVKVLEKRVSLDDMENYLKNKYAGIEFACTGEDNSIRIFYTEGKEDLKEEITAMLDRNLKIPGRFVSCFSLKTIPRYDTGKIMYSRLKEMNCEDERNHSGNV